MDDAVVVRGFQRLCNLPRDGDGLVLCKASGADSIADAVFGDQLVESSAIDEFDDERANTLTARLFGRVKENVKGTKRDGFMNISVTENEALQELAAALKIREGEDDGQP